MTNGCENSLKLTYSKSSRNKEFWFESAQAACESADGREPSDVPKYRSKVLFAASSTRWQSLHSPKCRSISLSTEGESLPSKYQQIRWIVSLQLMCPPLFGCDQLALEAIAGAFDLPKRAANRGFA